MPLAHGLGSVIGSDTQASPSLQGLSRSARPRRRHQTRAPPCQAPTVATPLRPVLPVTLLPVQVPRHRASSVSQWEQGHRCLRRSWEGQGQGGRWGTHSGSRSKTRDPGREKERQSVNIDIRGEMGHGQRGSHMQAERTPQPGEAGGWAGPAGRSQTAWPPSLGIFLPVGGMGGPEGAGQRNQGRQASQPQCCPHGKKRPPCDALALPGTSQWPRGLDRGTHPRGPVPLATR